MYRYQMIIFWSEEDQLFVVDVPELAGCMAHGESPDEAVKNVQDAMALWIDTTREYGEPVPEPKGRRLVYA